jgi:hypothetical protein
MVGEVVLKLHEVPSHLIIVPLVPTAQPSLGDTMNTSPKFSVVGEGYCDQAESDWTPGIVRKIVVITTSGAKKDVSTTRRCTLSNPGVF